MFGTGLVRCTTRNIWCKFCVFCKHDYKVEASPQRNQAESNNSGVLCFGNGCSDLVGYQNVFVDAYLIVVTIHAVLLGQQANFTRHFVIATSSSPSDGSFPGCSASRY
jgi:hypothetical protein